MWLTLSTGSKSSLTISDRQSIWPAPDGSDAELVITTNARITEEVLIASPRLVRLRYTLDAVEILMSMNDLEPRPWPDSKAINGKSFEVMITDRGAIIVPTQGPRLPNRYASWLNILAEDLRCSWSVPPGDAKVGSRWKVTPAFPGGLPPHTTSADFDVNYELAALEGAVARVNVSFGIHLMIEAARGSQSGKGSGEMTVELEQSRGVKRAVRQSRIEVTSTVNRNQLLRSAMELSRT